MSTSIKKGKMMIYEDEGYLNECLSELPRATYADGKKHYRQDRKKISAWFLTQEQSKKALERRMRS